MDIRVELLVPGSRRQVWSELADLASHPTWMRDAAGVEFLGPLTSGPGTRMRIPTRVGPLRTVDIIEVTGWIEGRRIEVSHQGLVSGTGRFTLEGDDPTSVTWEETLRFPWWMGGRLTAMLARPVLRALWAGNLRRFASAFNPGGTATAKTQDL